MRTDSWFRGALLSVLFFALLSGGAPSMATTQQSDSGQSPDGSTTCGGGNCASNDTLTVTGNGGGTPGAGNPLSGNPLGGDLTGGMGDPAPVQTPGDLSAVNNFYKAHQAAQSLNNLCQKVGSTNTAVAFAVLAAAIAAATLALVVLTGGAALPVVPAVGALLAAAGIGFAAHAAVSSWCSNDFAPWYNSHFG